MFSHSNLFLRAKPSFFSGIFLFLFFLFITSCASSSKGTPPTSRGAASGSKASQITHITADTTGDTTVVQVEATRPFKHLSYMLDKHKRLAIEIEGMKPAFTENTLVFGKGLVDHVTVNDFSQAGVLRLEVKLNRPADYDARMKDRVLFVSFTPRKVPDPQEQADPAQHTMKEAEIHHLKSEVVSLQEKIAGLQAQLERTTVLLEPETVKPEAAKPPVVDPGKASDVLGSLQDWLKAWQAKDIEKYGSHYADAFTHEKQDKKLWIEEKSEKFEKAGKIIVEMENPRVSIDGNWATVKFIQHYQSDSHKDTGTKVLIMKKEGGGWKIQSETWEPIEKTAR